MSTPHQRAMAAADALEAAGEKVTVRAVRQKAGVSRDIAVSATREWNTKSTIEQHLDVTVLHTSDRARARMDGLWGQMLQDAWNAVEPTVKRQEAVIESLQAKIRTLETEISAMKTAASSDSAESTG